MMKRNLLNGTYAGETVDVTETAIELYNERQRQCFHLKKLL